MANKIKIDPTTILAIGAGVAVIWGLSGIKKFFNSLGITESQDTKNVDKVEETLGNNTNPYNPTFWQKGGQGTFLLKDIQCKEMFDTMEDAWGYFDDDEEKVFGVIKKFIKTQSQWSFFSYWMAQKKSIDLFDYLRGGAYWSRFEDSDMQSLNQYIYSLPKYKL